MVATIPTDIDAIDFAYSKNSLRLVIVEPTGNVKNLNLIKQFKNKNVEEIKSSDTPNYMGYQSQ